MLVQWTQRDIADHGVRFRRAIIRHPRFTVSVFRSHRIAIDWGMQAEVVYYMTQLQRSQLSILLEGRGYFVPHGTGAEWTLGPGDIVESHQRWFEHEGYSGSPFEGIIVEWDDGTLFGPAHEGPARRSRLRPADVAGLRGLVNRFPSVTPSEWVAELAARLHAIGQRTRRDDRIDVAASPALARLFRILGDTLTRLEERPALVELADALDVTERQANRHFAELEREYRHPNDGWRSFIHDARLGFAMHMLSVPNVPIAEVARLSGYGSAVALSHALARRGTDSPGVLARRLAARWR